MSCSYEIHPRSIELGGGWKLSLLSDGIEIGGGVFPPAEDIDDEKKASQLAYDDALNVASEWIETREI